MQTEMGCGRAKDGLDVLHEQLLKAFHDGGSQCYRPIVIVAGWVGLLLNWYYCGGFETHGDNRLAQGDVEDVREDILELLGTVLQDTTRYVILSSCLAWIDPGEGPLYAGCGQTEGLSSVPVCCSVFQSGQRIN